MVEIISKAAVRYKSKVYAVDRPGRHDMALRLMWKDLESQGITRFEFDCKSEIQGFVTSKGRFVDRQEGAKIALDSGQIEKLNWPGKDGVLYSEDLW